MSLKMMRIAAVAAVVSLTAFAAHAEDWVPPGPIKLLIAYGAGGGVDTQARILGDTLKARHGWQVIPENLTGGGGTAMARALAQEPADGLTIGMLVDEVFTYNGQVMDNPGFERSDFDMISTITGTQMGIFARADRGWTSLAQVIEAARSGEKITVATASDKQVDGTYLLSKANGVEMSAVRVNGGKASLNAVMAGDVDLGWGGGVQSNSVLAGDVVNVVSGEAVKLLVSPDAPQLSEFGVKYDFGSKFMIVAPAGIPAQARETMIRYIGEIVEDPTSQLNEYVKRAFAGPLVIAGDDLTAFIDERFVQTQELIAAASN